MTEISGSKRRLEEMLGMKVNHFAYPYGTSQEVNQKVIEMAKKSGFHTAAIANGGGSENTEQIFSPCKE